MSPNMRNLSSLEKHAEEVELIRRAKAEITRVEAASNHDRHSANDIDEVKQERRRAGLQYALGALSGIPG